MLLNMTRSPRVFITRLRDDYLAPISEGLAFINLGEMIKPGDTVFIKPNLTYPYYKEGVMTRPDCVERLIIALKDYSVNIIVGEADGGGYNRFSMDEVFVRTGLKSVCKKYNVRIVNLSNLTSREISFRYKRKDFFVPIPELLLDGVDLVITVPVPKVHANTIVSLAIKNQWGCIQEPLLRLKLHPYFSGVIYEVNKAVKARVSVVDGWYGLNRNGPMRGDPVKLGWLMVADNILAADMVCCELIGISPLSVSYLRVYHEKEPLPPLANFSFSQDFTSFAGPRFFLKRDTWDYPGYFCFRVPLLAYLAYHSPASRLLHKGLYLFRKKFYDHK
jgi:uncharacterized protein (DUF362 family)